MPYCRVTLRQNPTVPDMPELTIGRMASLYNLHRSTLYEAVEKGRVTSGLNGKGQKVIDLSEMIRVYGEPPNKERSTVHHPTPTTEHLSDTPGVMEKFDALLEIVKEQRDELRQLREEVSQLRRLPPPPKPERSNSSRESEDPHGFRSLVQSLRQSNKK